MLTFLTSDGVRLAYERRGRGEPLVLVHGGATTHRCFDLVVDLLADSFLTVRYDRRGHGQSEPGEASIARQASDLLELAEHIGGVGGVRVLGYSFGGTIALEAAGRPGSIVRSLVVYEPPYGVPGLLNAAERILALLTEDRRDEAARLFVSDTFHLSVDLVDRMTRHEMWNVTLQAVPNMRDEVPALASWPTPDPQGAFPPTRVLVAESGGNPAFHDIADALHEAVGAQIVEVPGLPHFAMATAPEAFAAAVCEHLDRT